LPHLSKNEDSNIGGVEYRSMRDHFVASFQYSIV